MKILIYCCLLCLPFGLSAQKVLQIEKRNSSKTEKIKIGNQIIYKIKNDDIWYEATIEDISPDEGYLILHNRVVNVEDITALKSYKNRDWSRSLSDKLYKFAASWIVFGLADYFIFNQSVARITLPLLLIPAGTAVGVGWMIRKIFAEKVYKIGRKYRLRLLDLEPIPAPAPIP